MRHLREVAGGVVLVGTLTAIYTVFTILASSSPAIRIFLGCLA